jgi:hypothetical protein
MLGLITLTPVVTQRQSNVETRRNLYPGTTALGGCRPPSLISVRSAIVWRVAHAPELLILRGLR